jgi:hypothetical protein
MHVQNKWRVPEFLNHLTDKDLNHSDNLMPSCRICNNWKATHSLETFRNEIAEQLIRLHKYSPNYRLAQRYGLIKEVPKKIIFYFEYVYEMEQKFSQKDHEIK